jgi:2-polyprenyl-3-methyl-5-hydroxy-6-metoxy-1,4-benzoquinol methylase
MSDNLRQIAESVASRFPRDRWRAGYIRGKIQYDPIYNAVFEAVVDSKLPLWDGGCGIGLLAFYLRERGWRGPIIGTDLSDKKICLAKLVAERFYEGIDFSVGDLLTIA